MRCLMVLNSNTWFQSSIGVALKNEKHTLMLKGETDHEHTFRALALIVPSNH